MAISQQTQYWEIAQMSSKYSENVSLFVFFQNIQINQLIKKKEMRRNDSSQELFQTVRGRTLDFLEEPLLRYDD